MSETFKYTPRLKSDGDPICSTCVHEGIDSMDAETCRFELHRMVDFFHDKNEDFWDIYFPKSFWENHPGRTSFVRVVKEK